MRLSQLQFPLQLRSQFPFTSAVAVPLTSSSRSSLASRVVVQNIRSISNTSSTSSTSGGSGSSSSGSAQAKEETGEHVKNSEGESDKENKEKVKGGKSATTWTDIIALAAVSIGSGLYLINEVKDLGKPGDNAPAKAKKEEGKQKEKEESSQPQSQ